MNSMDLMRIFTRVFYVFPIKKNRVVLTAYNGRQYGCSPKYITEGLVKENNEFEVFYALKKSADFELPAGASRVKYRSLKHFYLLMTAKFIVFNSTGFSGLLPYRKQQVVINTWHGGGAYKKTGISAFKTAAQLKKRKISGDNTTYFISSSKAFGDIQCYSMCLTEDKLLNIGTPRNDIMFGEHNDIVEKVYSYFGVDRSCGLVLYAPTYRDGEKSGAKDYNFDPIDVQLVIDAAKERYGKEFKFLFRAHHNMMPDNLADNCLNATSYKDMQELLVASDILITDYSSSIWDFALTKKAGFLYAPDKEIYPKKIHELASPIDTWQYPVAESNLELAKLIRNFDESVNESRIDNYFKEYTSYETGNAVFQLIKTMKTHM